MTFVELNDLYQEFKNKYNGKYTDYDGAYGAQCWDLAQRFFVEYLGVPEYVLSGSGLVSNMLDRDRAELNEYFNEIPLTEMCPGDVCIWEYGHIAIFDHWDGSQNWYFSQNPNPCQVMPVNGNGLHAFRAKWVTNELPKVEEPKEDSIEENVVEDTKVKELEEEISILKNQKLVLEERIIDLVDQLDILTENEPKQVFKCAKTGMYKIKLKENEILYIG